MIQTVSVSPSATTTSSAVVVAAAGGESGDEARRQEGGAGAAQPGTELGTWKPPVSSARVTGDTDFCPDPGPK